MCGKIIHYKHGDINTRPCDKHMGIFNFRRATEIRSEIIGDLLQVTQILRFELHFKKKTTKKGEGVQWQQDKKEEKKKLFMFITFS